MTTGSLFHETCYASQVDALTAACSAVAAFAPDGSRSVCPSVVMTGPTPSSTSGGAFPGKVNVSKYGPDGAFISSLTATVNLQACERYDQDYWAPVIGAWFAAIVAVIAARVLYTRIFNRETL